MQELASEQMMEMLGSACSSVCVSGLSQSILPQFGIEGFLGCASWGYTDLSATFSSSWDVTE